MRIWVESVRNEKRERHQRDSLFSNYDGDLDSSITVDTTQDDRKDVDDKEEESRMGSSMSEDSLPDSPGSRDGEDIELAGLPNLRSTETRNQNSNLVVPPTTTRGTRPVSAPASFGDDVV